MVVHGAHSEVLSAIDAARMGLMGDVANAARESYSRSSDLIVKLQALREVELSADMLCTGELRGTSEGGDEFTKLAKSDKKDGWDWDNSHDWFSRGLQSCAKPCTQWIGQLPPGLACVITHHPIEPSRPGTVVAHPCHRPVSSLPYFSNPRSSRLYAGPGWHTLSVASM